MAHSSTAPINQLGSYHHVVVVNEIQKNIFNNNS